MGEVPRSIAARPLRSLLFAPANEPRKTDKLAQCDADAIVLDLEDAVAKEHKVAARAIAKAALPGLAGPIRTVRVNAFDTGLTPGDVAGVVCADLDAIILPKVESPQDLRRLDVMLTEAEQLAGLPHGHVQVIALVETCVGIAAAGDIARASARLGQIAFGSGDLGKDLNLPTMLGDHTPALAYGRAKLVYDCRAAGLPGPLDGPHLQVRDLEALERECLAARALGHRGKVCIHPGQVAIANRVFGPAAEDIAYAHQVITEFRAAEARGAASIMVGGLFVDYPIVDKAERLLALAESIAARGKN